MSKVRIVEHGMAALMCSGKTEVDKGALNGHEVGDTVTVTGQRYDRMHAIAAIVRGSDGDGYHLERDDRPSPDPEE